jgi:hypothetical protein
MKRGPESDEDPESDDEAVVRRAAAMADAVLFPAAQDVDRSGRVPTESLEALAEAGLFGIVGPRSHGGVDLAPGLARRTMAAIGGGCGATFFVWAQHHTVVRSLRSSANEALVQELLTKLCTGDLLAGVAFAHVRRPGPPVVGATRVDGGWILDGHMPWTTSWGIADLFSVAAVSARSELVWAMLSAPDLEGVTAVPLALPVFGATGTVALSFDRCFVPEHHIAHIESVDDWRSLDRITSSIGQPAVLGVAERSIRLLGDAGDGMDTSAGDASVRLGDELASRWVRDDEILSAMSAGRDVVLMGSDHRAACIDLARRSTTALLASVGGRGMDLGHPAQRLAREADFYVIQAQTVDGRAATLRSV